VNLDAFYRKYERAVLGRARRLVGRDAAEDVASEAWRAFLAAYGRGAVGEAALWSCITYAAKEHRRAVALLAKKRDALSRGEVMRSGGRTCPWCGRPSRGRNAEGSKDGLCEAHYYRRRRALAKGRKPDMAAPIQPTLREQRKIRDEDVPVIRARLARGEKRSALAKEYGVWAPQIGRIGNGQRRGGPKRTPGKGARTDLRLPA
jgi:hypothetical protein